MFDTTFTSDITSWLPDQVLNMLGENIDDENDDVEIYKTFHHLDIDPPGSPPAFKNSPEMITVSNKAIQRPLPPKKAASERNNFRKLPRPAPVKTKAGGRNVNGSTMVDAPSPSRSLSPSPSPKPFKKKVLIRSLSQDSPRLTERKEQRTMMNNKTKHNLNSRRRPAPVKTKKTNGVSASSSMIHSPLEKFSPYHKNNSVDTPSPSPKLLNVMTTHLSEDVPMSPKILFAPSSSNRREFAPSLLGRMVRARKKAIPNGFGMLKSKSKTTLVKNEQNINHEDEDKENEATGVSEGVPEGKVEDMEECIKKVLKGLPPVFKPQEIIEDLAETEWDFTGRPEIQKQ